MEVMIIMNLEKNFYLLTNIVNKILKRNYLIITSAMGGCNGFGCERGSRPGGPVA